MVSRVVFGRGSFSQLEDIIAPKRLSVSAPFIFLVDAVFEKKATLSGRIPLAYDDKVIFLLMRSLKPLK